MVICLFYLQGNCRFGDRCWNEHPQQDLVRGGRQRHQRGDFLVSPDRRSLVRSSVAASDFNRQRELISQHPQHGSPVGDFSFRNLYNSTVGSRPQQEPRYQRTETYRSPLSKWEDDEMQEEQNFTKHSRWNDPGLQREFSPGSPQAHWTQQQHSGFVPQQQELFGGRSPTPAASFSFRQALTQTAPQSPPHATASFPYRSTTTRDFPTQASPKTEPHRTVRHSADTSTYTPMSELTEAEKTQYLLQTFTLGKIPTRPPPQEVCF